MKKALVFCVLVALWLSLAGSGVWAQDVGWMQQGVRVWYFGSAGNYPSSSNAVEAYLFGSVNGHDVQLIKHSALNYWGSPQPIEINTYSLINQGPFWIHPQVLQTIAVGDKWNGIDITNIDRTVYTYDTFKNNAEFASIPYLLLPIKALFDLNSQREIVKVVYGIPYWPGYPVWGTVYFDSETGLCLFNLKLTVYNTVWFLLSEINYDFATHRAFAEDNGPHTGFKSTVLKTKSAIHFVQILSSVESRYGGTVQMWTATQAGGASGSYFGVNENYCFFGSVPVLKRKLMEVTPDYPPENWNEYGDYLWWWVPAEALADSTINIFNVSMARTSTAPYTFTGSGGTSLYFSKLIFDNDGYMTDFSAKDIASIGLDLDLGTLIDLNIKVDGLDYYRNTMGRATPAGIEMVDFDGDGKTDVAIYRASTGVWWITPSSGAAAYGYGWGGTGFTPVPGDYDGDGKTDIAIYDTTGGAWWIVPSSGAPAYGYGWGGSGFTAVPKDYDGDGKTDIAIYDATGGAWWIVPSSGAPAYGYGWGGTGFTPVPGDYDGDGKADIAIYQNSTGAWWIVPSSGAPAYGYGWGGTGFTPVPGDYDGDGKADIAIYQNSTGTWWVVPSSGAPAYGYGWGGTGFTPVPGDYDGDGKADIAIYQASNGMWWIVPSSGAPAYGVGWGGDASDVPIVYR